MPTYVAFLRAINLGAKRKFPRDAIRSVAEDAGFTEVETYINTGNLRVATGMRSRAKVELALERAFLADRGFEVPTIAFSPAELREIAAAAEDLTADHDGRHYVSLLKDPPDAEAAKRIEALGGDGERAHVVGRSVHLLLGDAYHSAGLTNASVERLLGVATNRNLNVIRTLAQKWGT